MSGRGPMPCRFGVDCHRRDCWYSHPAGRAIDAGGGGGGGGNRGSNGASGAGGAAAGGGGGGGGGMRLGAMPGGGGGMMPQASPRMGGGDGSSGGGGKECRYSYECKRQNCHFSHPFGRAIDADGGGGGGGGRPSLNRPPSNNSIGSLSRGMSEMSFGDYPPASATDDLQDLKDTWFPKARDCTCCKGYVYGCTADICQMMGQCTCSIEEEDLDGGGSEVASNISRTSSPAVGMGANGGLMGVGGEGARPPQPPTEAAMAAAAVAAGGGGGRPSSGRGGGGAECRYGTGCKRANCSFSHPKGRSMDADGLSFGDFGGGGGGGVPGGKATSTAQQDLMDTWYPACRECACCKGYKHGCKTTACEAAGLCACSSGGGPAAPISAVVGTDSSSKPEAPATTEQGGEGVGSESTGEATSPPAQATA